MNNEEIDYWLRLFSNNNQAFMSKDGKKITLFKVFQELKELQYLLKIKNDHIKQLQQENKQLKENYERTYNENRALREKQYITDTDLIYENYILSQVIDKAIKYIEDTYYSKNTTGIDSIVLSSDKLLKIREILKEVE